ncbi:DHA2 family efflux MFS transporter permease subunit [Streptomyces pinistramenti]|uniref:DHA2 family efflux MFS transporter permease subunit n=1 Tax=Streptomyces pinistramenti TaxID=2884812 RepID=UPI001D0708BA|nr:DHA2 family efflux MFS transporter permease subunit [Streptomyces pinistramenti]MCB5910001.1 DHA2 family efflux MFS transporter permease subunit [Streptomyces pinistramenti]
MSQVRDDRLDAGLLRLIGVTLLGGIMGILDSTMVTVAADTLAEEFHTTLSAISWASTGYLLALTVTIPVTSWAVGRFGVKKLWLFGLTLFLAGSLASALAWNLWSLVAFRVVQGVGAGVVDPLVLVILARAAGAGRAGRVMGMMGVVLSLGPVLGPVLGGVVLESLGWRSMFYINLPIGIVAVLLALRVIPAGVPAGKKSAARLDLLGAVLMAPGFAAIVLALTEAGERGRLDAPSVLIPLIGGIVLLVGYVLHALRTRRHEPLIDVRLFSSRSFAASVTVQGLVGLATFAGLFALPLYYQVLHGHGARAAGLLVAPLGLGSALAMPLAGRLSDRLGARSLVRGGALVAALGAVALTRIGPDSSEVWSALAAFAIGMGLGGVGAPTMGSLYRTLPPEKVPQGSSVVYNLNQLGGALGVACVALILAVTGTGTGPAADLGSGIGGFRSVYWFVCAVAVVIVAAASLLPGRPETPDAAPDDASAGDEPGQTPAGERREEHGASPTSPVS